MQLVHQFPVSFLIMANNTLQMVCNVHTNLCNNFHVHIAGHVMYSSHETWLDVSGLLFRAYFVEKLMIA